MFALIARYSDGCTYQTDETIAVFEDEDVANLVAEDLMLLAKKQGSFRNNLPDKNGGFAVKPIAVFKAESESRVRGIVDQLLRAHFPR